MPSIKNISALVIDDEPLAHQVIETYAQDLDFLEIAGHCHRATEAYGFLAEHAVDLIFLDINMPKLKGLDFLRTLDRRPKVIITSAYGEYALESFELQVSDYLLKPFRFSRFLRAVNKVRQELEKGTVASSARGAAAGARNHINSSGASTEITDHLFVKVDRQYRRLDFKDLHYLESYGNYVKLWTSEEDFLLTARTLSSFQSELPPSFQKIHKSYIVNKALVDYLEGNQLAMRNGQVLPVGKLQREAVKRWIVG